MNMIKKLFLGFVSVITIVGITGSFFTLYPRRYDDGLRIDHLSGDYSALDELKIKGILSDGIQKMEFVFDNGTFGRQYSVVTDDSITDYIYNEHVRSILGNDFIYKVYLIPDDADKKISESIDEQGNRVTKTSANKAIIRMFSSGILFQTDIVILSDDYGFYGIERKKKDEEIYWMEGGLERPIDAGIGGDYLKPIETIHGKHFLYTTTGTDCTGVGGIYELKREKDYWLVIDENLAPLDVKNGAVQIVGMRGSKDWFVYITVHEDQVVLHPFNRQSNCFEDDITVGALPETAKTEWNERFVIQEPFYNATVQDNGICNIEMIEKPEDAYSLPKSHFYSVDLTEGKVLLSYEEDPFFYNEQNGQYLYDPNYSETVMKYKKNRLYVLRSYRETITSVMQENASSQYEDYISIFENTSSRNSVHISIFENNRSIYEGELLSAARDDYAYQGDGTYQTYGYPYMRSYYYFELD
jgi:hypothetical protein